ncbi:MAG: hypothetical protein D6731_25095 [Planctomycetota bacterium]|nr:MAG: hypothetical protein D6731_25095 [Planctomycetota bacterium]
MDIDYGMLKQALREVLAEEGASDSPLAKRFRGGTLELRPADPSLQSRELPLEEFFKKVVRVRDALRVLEQKINGHERLGPEDKKVLQGYITRAYGTLTSFNLLFQEKDDHFRGQRGK